MRCAEPWQQGQSGRFEQRQQSPRSQEVAGRDESEAGRPFVMLMLYPKTLGRNREVSRSGQRGWGDKPPSRPRAWDGCLWKSILAQPREWNRAAYDVITKKVRRHPRRDQQTPEPREMLVSWGAMAYTAGVCAVSGSSGLSMGFSRQEHWSGLPWPPPRDLPHPGIEPASPVSPASAGGFSTADPPGQPVPVLHLHKNELPVG